MRLLIVILSIFVASIAYSDDSIPDDTLFVRKIESLMPSMVAWRLDELHQIRREVTPLEYVGICEYYARKYHDWRCDESAIEMSADSIIWEGIDHLLKERNFNDRSTPYLLMRCATRLLETGYDFEAGMFASVGVEVALAQGNGGYIYGELRCLESDIYAANDPEGSLQTKLNMLRGFKSQYERQPKDDTYEQYLRNLIKSSELALRLDNVGVADSLLQESLDLVYDRKNPDVASRKVSVLLPMSPYRFQIAAIESEIALRKGDRQKSLDIQESLLWRYYEVWAMGELPTHDYISYFKAIASLIEADRFNKQNCEHLIYASKIIKDWICNLSFKTSPRLREAYYTAARNLIQQINAELVKHVGIEDVNETIYDNVLLFKNLQLQVNRAFLLNKPDDPRLNFSDYKEDFDSHVIVALLRTTLDHLHKQWSLEREALETSDFLKWIKCDWSAVRDCLPPDGVAIEFFTTQSNGHKSCYAAITDGKTSTPRILGLFDDSSIPALSSDRLYRDKTFSKKVWSKLCRHLSPGDCVYYSPDAKLYNIALEHLQSLTENDKCMADIYKILRVSTTRELAMNRNKGKGKKPRIAIFSNIDYDKPSHIEEENPKGNLYDSIDKNRGSLISCLKTKGRFQPLGISVDSLDLAKIAENFGIKYDLYDKTSATVKAFQNLSGKDYNVIHLATHGFYIPVDSIYHNAAYQKFSFLKFSPEISAENLSLNSCGLALSGANGIFDNEKTDTGGNGILTAAEISTVNLSKIDFIFLSACQTGLGYISSDGLYGMQRGFKIAGVKSMIYTLWDVNDDACDMFEKEFYTNYFAGRSKYESFVAARNKLRSFTGVYNGHSYDFSNPKYWAGFVLHDGF